MSSLNQARQFNQKGVYTIGNAETKHLSPEDLCLSKLIKLEIELEIEKISRANRMEKETKKKTYTYENLVDLKNILMLVARKTTSQSSSGIGLNESLSEFDDIETLEYFIQIFDNVCRLANVYIKLMSTGCLFFKNFLAKVYCDQSNKLSRSSHATVNISILSGLAPLKLENKQEETLKSLNGMRLFFENCLDFWVNHVNTIRDSYMLINYYTTNQVVYLQQVLGEILAESGQCEEFHVLQAFALLSFIRDDLDKSKLVAAYAELKLKFQSLRKKTESRQKLNTYEDKHNEFINRLALANDFSRAVVKKAVSIYGTSNEQEIITYCLENEFDEYSATNAVEDNEFEMIGDDQDTPMSLELNQAWVMRKSNLIRNFQYIWHLHWQYEFKLCSL